MMKAMIFAAGLGTRLKPLTDTLPKALVPIAGKPLLEHLILKLKAAGFTDIVVNVHHLAEQIIRFLKENNNFGLHMVISDESDMLLETGGGLRKAQPFFADQSPFLVHNVDILSNIELGDLMQRHRPADLATVVVSSRETARYLLFDGQHRLGGWVNRETGETRPQGISTEGLHPLAFSGIQVVSPRVFDVMAEFPTKFSMMDLYLKCCKTDTIRAYVPQNYRMMDVGKIDCITEAQSFVSHLE